MAIAATLIPAALLAAPYQGKQMATDPNYTTQISRCSIPVTKSGDIDVLIPDVAEHPNLQAFHLSANDSNLKKGKYVQVNLKFENQNYRFSSLVINGQIILGVGIGHRPKSLAICDLDMANDFKSAKFKIQYSPAGGGFVNDPAVFNLIMYDALATDIPIYYIVDPKVHDNGVQQ